MTTFSQKGYVEVAAVLRREYERHPNRPLDMSAASMRRAIEDLTEGLADLFAHDNPRFKRTLFYRAALGRDTLRPVSTVETGREEQGNE